MPSDFSKAEPPIPTSRVSNDLPQRDRQALPESSRSWGALNGTSRQDDFLRGIDGIMRRANHILNTSGGRSTGGGLQHDLRGLRTCQNLEV